MNNIISKVRKLLSVADGKANDFESSTALMLAHQLMKDHSIQMVDLDAVDELEVEADIWGSEDKSQFDTYAVILSQATGVLFDCQYWKQGEYVRGKKRWRICFAGEKVDLTLAIVVWPWLVKMAIKSSRHYCGKGWSPSHRSFAEGFALTILDRATLMHEADQKASSCVNATENDVKYGLVVQAKDDAVQKMFDDLDIELKVKQKRMGGKVDHDASLAGIDSGHDVNLDFRKGITGKPKVTKLIE